MSGELREQVRDWLIANYGEHPVRNRDLWFHDADALISGPLAPLLEALRLIDRNGCENLTRGRCSGDSGRTRDSEYTSTQWCPPCIAADALDGPT